MTTGNDLRREIERRGLSIAKAAREMHLSEPTVRKYLTRGARPLVTKTQMKRPRFARARIERWMKGD